MPDTPVPDSYVETVEAADAFFATKQSASAWAASSSAVKIKALQEATAIIDSLPLAGYRYELSTSRTGYLSISTKTA